MRRRGAFEIQRRKMEGRCEERKGEEGGENENLRDINCACAHMWTHLKDSTTLFVFQLNWMF